MDELNDISYAYHYRNLDSTAFYADRAYEMAEHYGSGRAEALNNLAFVSMARMDYDKASRQLEEALSATDNRVEQLISHVMLMRLCQRMSHNREFYDYCERAKTCIARINEERERLPERMCRRLVYAESEFAITNSAYYYYVGLERQSIEALASIDANGMIKNDTAQYLNYLYNVGAGGIITEGTQSDINQQEYESLIKCLYIAKQHGFIFFIANSLEALSEHLSVPEYGDQLISDNVQTVSLILPDSIPHEEAASWMAEQALSLFRDYGDIYQIAGAHRSLASCFMTSGDYESALLHFEEALSNPKIEQAPDLVASIREQLCIAYSAINDKPSSDNNRNLYLDLQEQTRQDRYLESRAGILEKASSQLNMMIAAVMLAIIVLSFMLWLFVKMNRKKNRTSAIDELLKPLKIWQDAEKRHAEEIGERMEEIKENYALNFTHIKQGERRSLESRAKVSLINSIIPFIDRMINEVSMLSSRQEDESIRSKRYEYISELTSKINEYNDVLTHWIQMRQGSIDLHIGSFPLNTLFTIVAKGKTGFRMNGVELIVKETDAVVKADKVLTLFMINTLADNARKFTASGGFVTIGATQSADYVEISVSDTGRGMTPDELENIFEHKIYNGHGFGLMNCRGIIEKYRKLSRIFSVCMISAESEKGKGSRFFFRLPKGVMRMLVMTAMLFHSFCFASTSARTSLTADGNTSQYIVETYLSEAKAYADSAYFSNIAGTFERTLMFADSCRKYLNLHYVGQNPDGKTLMLDEDNLSVTPPEVEWFHDSIPTNYNIILDIRNESAVAALALHEWRLYSYNNKVYTQLFKEMSADNTLADYCRTMQESQTNKTIAVILLVLLLVSIPPAYYLLYYRHRLYFRFCVERINAINDILLSEDTPEEKLRLIMPLTHEQYPSDLQNVVSHIIQALKDASSLHHRQFADIEIAEDECRKMEFEDNNLYISNSILDNCLSSLKHETMYYPNRIAQLLDDADNNLSAISELVTYYRDIYSILSEQVMLQTDRVKIHVEPIAVRSFVPSAPDDLYILADRNMLQYMFEIIGHNGGCSRDRYKVEQIDDRYLRIIISMPSLKLTLDEVRNLFNPDVSNIPYLLCRQIVRDHSEQTNRRGCGIMADMNGDEVEISIIMPQTKPRQKSIIAMPDLQQEVADDDKHDDTEQQ
ncbi:MAG: DUF5112 domain-containing protein [Prevotella sp.]